MVSTYYCLLNTSDMADSWIESGKYKMSLECLVVIESKKKKKKKKSSHKRGKWIIAKRTKEQLEKSQ